ncbi:hypothetical protein EDC01DRAFT_524521 [Geopyxis carbonaria]|nr:hypothetical protein EDC01DRAFT_524521 [Geopyxis carbonaria]
MVRVGYRKPASQLSTTKSAIRNRQNRHRCAGSLQYETKRIRTKYYNRLKRWKIANAHAAADVREAHEVRNLQDCTAEIAELKASWDALVPEEGSNDAAEELSRLRETIEELEVETERINQHLAPLEQLSESAAHMGEQLHAQKSADMRRIEDIIRQMPLLDSTDSTDSPAEGLQQHHEQTQQSAPATLWDGDVITTITPPETPLMPATYRADDDYPELPEPLWAPEPASLHPSKFFDEVNRKYENMLQPPWVLADEAHQQYEQFTQQQHEQFIQEQQQQYDQQQYDDQQQYSPPLPGLTPDMQEHEHEEPFDETDYLEDELPPQGTHYWTGAEYSGDSEPWDPDAYLNPDGDLVGPAAGDDTEMVYFGDQGCDDSNP